MTVAAALLLTASVILARPPGRWWVRRRLGGRDEPVPVRWVVVVGGVVVAIGVPYLPQLSGPRLVLAATVAAVGVFAVRQVRRGRERDRVARSRSETLELLGLMLAELRAGLLPQHVLHGLTGDFPVVGPAAHAAALGGDVADALRDASRQAGHEVLRDLAGAWIVSERSGAPLATVIARLEQTARVDRDVLREVESGIAPARATGRLMAVLPALGLLLGSGTGGDPVTVLTSTWIGVACLAAGCALACAGVAWIERIATSAGDPA
jgi:tight adherence protein B